MPNHFLRAGKRVPVSFVIRDKFGNDATVDGVPAWASSDPEVLVVEPSEDGLSAFVRAIGPIGTSQITVTVDADLGEGVREITGTVALDARSGEANVLALTVGAEEDDVSAEPEPAPEDPTPAEPETPAPEDEEEAPVEPTPDEPADPEPGRG